jgi:hypothetical protein
MIIKVFLWILTIVIVGLGLRNLLILRKCEAVMGTCIESKYVLLPRAKREKYQSTFSYIYQDQAFTSKISTDSKLEEGVDYPLYVNANKPTEIFTKNARKNAITTIAIGCLMLILSIVA